MEPDWAVAMPSQCDTNGLVAKIMMLLRAGLTPEQCRDVLRLYLRACQGAYHGDGFGSATGDVLLDRRLAFVRWLVQHGRFAEYGEPPRRGHQNREAAALAANAGGRAGTSGFSLVRRRPGRE